MATYDKKWWLIHGTSGLLVAGLVVFGIFASCEDENTECDRCADYTAKVDSLGAARDSIVVLNDSISTLNAINDVLAEQLVECEESKKPAQPAARTPRKRTPAKPAKRTTAPARPAKRTAAPVVTQENPRANNNSNVAVAKENSQGGAVVTAPSNVGVVVEENFTNNGAFVAGHGNNVTVEQPTKTVTVKAPTVTVTVEEVRYVKRYGRCR